MADTVSPGSPVVVMQRSTTSPVQYQGVLVNGRELVVALRITADHTFEQGEEVLLVAGELGRRKVTAARFVSDRDGVSILRLLRGWQEFDARSNPRLPAGLKAEVRSVLGSSRQPATILDVSLGGMGVEVAAKPGGREIEVHLVADGFAARLPCESVGTEESPNGILLHLRFRELTAAQQAFVRNLVGTLAKALDAPPVRRAS
jgi:hypothetical protein